MNLPILNHVPLSRTMIDTFLGYNHNLRIGESEFYDMQNMTSSHYPILSPRDKRGVYLTPDNPQGLIAKDALCFIDGTDFVMNEYRINMGLSTAAEDCPKHLVSMGAYVIIMPDKKYINTKNLEDWGSIEAKYTSATTVNYELCAIDGTGFSNTTVSPSEPASPENRDYWLDTSSSPHTLKQYSATSAVWVNIATTYIKISCPNIAANFNQYDGVKISGIDSSLTQLSDLEGQISIVWEAHHEEGGAGDYIVVIGILDNAASQTTPLTISRDMPNLDFIIESENRLWGCRYGVAANGEVVNEIYASKLGDFKNWNCFMGLSTDSYAASCGTDGQWTGAITHLGYPLFFKENCLHKVYGNFPSNYQIQTTTCRGVQKGSENSLAIVNERLYYKSRNGICVYDGSLPVEISYKLGTEQYSDAVAGAHANKYYISMKDTKDIWHLFVYDSSHDMWHKEDNTQVKAFCSCRGELYFIDSDNKIKTIFGSGEKDKPPVKWMAETGIIGTSMPDKKYISRLNVRMSLDAGSRAMFFIQYDSVGEFEHLFTMSGTSLKSFTVPIRPRRCDHFKLRIEGVGDMKIYSITKAIKQGSDV